LPLPAPGKARHTLSQLPKQPAFLLSGSLVKNYLKVPAPLFSLEESDLVFKKQHETACSFLSGPAFSLQLQHDLGRGNAPQKAVRSASSSRIKYGSEPVIAKAVKDQSAKYIKLSLLNRNFYHGQAGNHCGHD